MIAKAGDRTLVAIGNAERGYAIVAGADHRINRILQTAAEAKCDSELFGAQDEHFLMKVSRRSYRSLGIHTD